jgi:hypothetical protein
MQHNRQVKGWRDLGPHCCNNDLDYIVPTMTFDITAALVSPLAVLLMSCLKYGIKNAFGILIYSKQYNFPIL